MLIYCHFACIISKEKTIVQGETGNMSLFSAFKIFSLSLTLSNLSMICLDIIFFSFFFLQVEHFLLLAFDLKCASTVFKTDKIIQSIVRVFTICIVYMFSFQPVSPMKSGVTCLFTTCALPFIPTLMNTGSLCLLLAFNYTLRESS